MINKGGESMRRAQAAIEYLMMLAVALMIVAIVIRYVRQAAEEAGRTINESSKTISEYLQKELSEVNNS